MAEIEIYDKETAINVINTFLSENLHLVNIGPRAGYYTAQGTEFTHVRIDATTYETSTGEERQEIAIILLSFKTGRRVRKDIKVRGTIIIDYSFERRDHYYSFIISSGAITVPIYYIVGKVNPKSKICEINIRE